MSQKQNTKKPHDDGCCCCTPPLDVLLIQMPFCVCFFPMHFRAGATWQMVLPRLCGQGATTQEAQLEETQLARLQDLIKRRRQFGIAGDALRPNAQHVRAVAEHVNAVAEFVVERRRGLRRRLAAGYPAYDATAASAAYFNAAADAAGDGGCPE